MALKNQVFFQQELDGKTVIDIMRSISYKSDKVEDRLKEVVEIMESTQFFAEYLENHFTANINAGDVLSQEINVFKAIESLASYILNSKEIKKAEDNEVQQYTFVNDRNYFEKLLQRESTNSESGEPIVFLKGKSKNQRKSKTLVITKADLKRNDEMGEVLRGYQSYKDFLTVELRKFSLQKRGKEFTEQDIKEFQDWSDRVCQVLGKVDEKSLTQSEKDCGATYPRIVFKTPEDLKPMVYDEKQISRTKAAIISGQVSDDMITTKRQLSGVFGEDLQNFYENSYPDYSRIDLTKVEHVYGYEEIEWVENKKGELVEKVKHIPGLMFFENNYELGSEMYLTFMMLEDAIKKAKFTEQQSNVLSLSRRGYSTKMIAEELEIEHQNINRTLKSAALRIVKACIELGYGADEE